MKKFIITIDTEGDNLWAWRKGDRITTENTKYLPRFQELCENYGFKPVWLTNYEMIQDDAYVDFIADVVARKTGELGMHLHAWNTPPEYELNVKQSGAPYLIEYPYDIMEEKIATMTDLIKSRTGIIPVSHRAGRWAINDDYFNLLIKYGYKVDCSVTPHIDWTSSVGASEFACGSDYSKYCEEPYWIKAADKNKALLEVPVSVRRIHKLILRDRPNVKNILGSFYRSITGANLWLRPNGNNYKAMMQLINIIMKSDSDYIMFMLHSSELMPDCNPTFKTKEDIEELYCVLKNIFSYSAQFFEGCMLGDYYLEKEKSK